MVNTAGRAIAAVPLVSGCCWLIFVWILHFRLASPRHGFTIMNRLSMENLTEPITKDLDFQLQHPFLLYRNARCKEKDTWIHTQTRFLCLPVSCWYLRFFVWHILFSTPVEHTICTFRVVIYLWPIFLLVWYSLWIIIISGRVICVSWQFYWPATFSVAHCMLNTNQHL